MKALIPLLGIILVGCTPAVETSKMPTAQRFQFLDYGNAFYVFDTATADLWLMGPTKTNIIWIKVPNPRKD